MYRHHEYIYDAVYRHLDTTSNVLTYDIVGQTYDCVSYIGLTMS